MQAGGQQAQEHQRQEGRRHEPPGMESGQAIGVRLAHREEAALEDAYALYGPSLLAYLRRYVGDEAEDVLQRTFLDVWRHAGRYDADQRFSTWLFTIAHRRAVDTLRTRRHRVVPVEAARDLVGEDGRETVERYADAAEVRAALTRLKAHEREVAHRLDVPLGTVKARASRATRHLGALMRDRSDEGGPT